jgi:hypothetical protein
MSLFIFRRAEKPPEGAFGEFSSRDRVLHFAGGRNQVDFPPPAVHILTMPMRPQPGSGPRKITLRKVLPLLCGTVSVLLVMGLAVSASAGTSPSTFSVTHVLGLEALARNSRCTLSIEGDQVHIEAGAQQEWIKASLIEDLFTGADSERVVHGTLEFLSLAVPFGGSRFLSLFRRKVDTLTLEYRDENGALHGAILTLKPGEAAEVKKQLLAAGAHTSMPPEP